MSLTGTIRAKSAGEVTIDGTTFLIQAVRDQSMFLSEGVLPVLMDAFDKDTTNEGFLARMRDRPEAFAAAIRLGMEKRTRTLRAGLQGERAADGSVVKYRMVEKDAHELEEGEINPALVPAELADALVAAIDALTSEPAEARDLSTFPE
jgi:hypothetical protein